MILEEKIWFINHIKTITVVSNWNLFIIKYIKLLLCDSSPEIMRYHDDLLEIVLKIISNRTIVNYIKLSLDQEQHEHYHEILGDLINIYLMRREDYSILGNKCCNP